MEEPTIPKDAPAIAIVNDNGETLGYIGSADPMREMVRRAMKYDNFMATISEVTGRYPNAKKTYTQGLRIAVGNVLKDGDDEPNFAPLFTQQGQRRTDRHNLNALHKGKELRRVIDVGWEDRDGKWYRHYQTKKQRRLFKAGVDIKSSQLNWGARRYVNPDRALDYLMAKRNPEA